MLIAPVTDPEVPVVAIHLSAVGEDGIGLLTDQDAPASSQRVWGEVVRLLEVGLPREIPEKMTLEVGVEPSEVE